MPISDKTKPDACQCAAIGDAVISCDEAFAATVSAYLDGELKGDELIGFEALLHRDDALSREVRAMQLIDSQLTEIGAEVLVEPIPDALLEALVKLERD